MPDFGSLMWFAAIASVGVAVHWAYTNANAGDRGRTKGLLAMREPGSEDEKAEGEKANAKKTRKPVDPQPYGVPQQKPSKARRR